jgi:hypothetical protein
MLEPIPAAESTFARKMGRFIFEKIPNDPDRGATVEETIANVLDYAANRAVAAGDQQNADQLIKIGKKWRQSIGKKEAAIDPDAPVTANNEGSGETGVLDLIMAPKNHRSLGIAGLSGAIAGLVAYRNSPKQGAKKKALMWAMGTLLGVSFLLRMARRDDAE